MLRDKKKTIIATRIIWIWIRIFAFQFASNIQNTFNRFELYLFNFFLGWLTVVTSWHKNLMIANAIRIYSDLTKEIKTTRITTHVVCRDWWRCWWWLSYNFYPSRQLLIIMIFNIIASFTQTYKKYVFNFKRFFFPSLNLIIFFFAFGNSNNDST